MPASLDHAASTTIRPEVVEAMVPLLADHAANPTGAHRAARRARRALEDAREEIAALVGVAPGEIVLTSGGTESDNLAIAGATAARGVPVCSAVEHAAVLEPVRRRGGVTVPVDARGVIDLDALADHLSPDTPVVSVMTVNNEIGTVQPVAEVAEVVRERAPQALVHTDAVQAFAWLDVAPIAAQVDLMSLSGHKIGAPVGVGVLVWRDGVPLTPLIWGGGQERGRRGGTPNVAGAVGFATAARLAAAGRAETVRRVGALRDRLLDGLGAALDGVVETGVVDGDRSTRIAANAHICIAGVEAEALLFLLDQECVAASAASSCSSGAQASSHVLAALGVPADLAGGSLRLSLGWSTTDAEVDHVLAVLPPIVERLRSTGS